MIAFFLSFSAGCHQVCNCLEQNVLQRILRNAYHSIVDPKTVTLYMIVVYTLYRLVKRRVYIKIAEVYRIIVFVTCFFH